MKEFKKIDVYTMYDVVVVGAGPASVSSAIYSARKGLKVAMIGDVIGGQVLTTNGIENIIGIPSTTGYDFSNSLEIHAKENEIAFHRGHKVVEIIDNKDYKIVKTDDDLIIKTKTVIIGTGAKHRELNVVGEKEFVGKGVHYCSTCDGPFYRNLDVSIIGGGNSGVEAALDMSNIAKSVNLIEFLPELKADKILQEKVYSNSKIKVITNAQVKEIKGSQFVTSLEYINRETKEIIDLKTDGVFVEIGLLPNTDIFKGLLDMNKLGEIKINELNETSVEGIFAAGDCTSVAYKQIIISMGEGAKAGLSAFNYIITK